MKLLTLPIAAKRLDVSPETVRRWGHAGKLRLISVGARKGYRVLEEDLNRIIFFQLNDHYPEQFDE